MDIMDNAVTKRRVKKHILIFVGEKLMMIQFLFGCIMKNRKRMLAKYFMICKIKVTFSVNAYPIYLIVEVPTCYLLKIVDPQKLCEHVSFFSVYVIRYYLSA